MNFRKAKPHRSLKRNGKRVRGCLPNLRPLMLEQLESRQLFASDCSDMVFTFVSVEERIDNLPFARIESHLHIRQGWQNNLETRASWGRWEGRARPILLLPEGEGREVPSELLIMVSTPRFDPSSSPNSHPPSNPISAARNDASLTHFLPIASTLIESKPQSSRPSSESVAVEVRIETAPAAPKRTAERNEAAKPLSVSTAVGIGMQINETKANPFQSASVAAVQFVSPSAVGANRLVDQRNNKSSPNLDALVYRKSVTEIEAPEPLGMTRLLFGGSLLTTRNERAGKQSTLLPEQRNAIGNEGKSASSERPTSLLADADGAFTQIPIPPGMVYLDWFAPAIAQNASLVGGETSRIQFAGANPLAVLQIFVGSGAFGFPSTNNHESSEDIPLATSEPFEPTPALVDLAWGRFDSLLFVILGGGVASYYSLQPKSRSGLQSTRSKPRAE